MKASGICITASLRGGSGSAILTPGFPVKPADGYNNQAAADSPSLESSLNSIIDLILMNFISEDYTDNVVSYHTVKYFIKMIARIK